MPVVKTELTATFINDKFLRVSTMESTKINNDTIMKDFSDFLKCIDNMNLVFETGYKHKPTVLPMERTIDFHRVLSEEVNELLDASKLYVVKDATSIDILTSYADTLGDIIVYCASEARRWGIPILEVLQKIMESQNSKLVDGKPLWNEGRTKFIKGPNFVAPEDGIKQVLLEASK